MSKGYSLHIGLNAVDPTHYRGWSGPLVACEFDARDMESIARFQDFSSSTLLLTQEATRDAVLGGIARAARDLTAGDIFFLSNSSHGGQVPDVNGDETGPGGDGLDETWCLYDGELIDDELYFALAEFAPGVRIIVVSDSCHSGTAIRARQMEAIFGDMFQIQLALSENGAARAVPLAPPKPRSRAMPREIQASVYLANKDFYDGIGKDEKYRSAKSQIKASAILMSGCQDNQESMDGAFNGAFTGYLKSMWNAGSFAGNYHQFVKAIRLQLPDSQSPNYFVAGAPNPDFENQRPFTV